MGDRKTAKKLQVSQNAEPTIQNIATQMMFVYGDDEVPLPACEAFVLDLVKQQVLLVTNEAYAMAKKRKSNEIRLQDLVYTMRHHPVFIVRLLKYAQAAQKIAEVTKDAEETEENSSKTKKMEGAYTDLMAALNSWNLDITPENIETYTDKHFEERQTRLAERVMTLKPAVYERFTDARKANFCGSSKKGTRRAKDPFIAWLGNPPLGKFADFVLAFIARETIATIAFDATTLRYTESVGCKNYFLNESATHSLQVRHYEQALRRNLGFRRRGNYLFGHY